MSPHSYSPCQGLILTCGQWARDYRAHRPHLGPCWKNRPHYTPNSALLPQSQKHCALGVFANRRKITQYTYVYASLFVEYAGLLAWGVWRHLVISRFTCENVPRLINWSMWLSSEKVKGVFDIHLSVVRSISVILFCHFEQESNEKKKQFPQGHTH